MDEFIDNLLRFERYCDIQLPRLQVLISLYKICKITFLIKKKINYFQKRQALEETDQLELYCSALDEDLEKMSSDNEEEEVKKEKPRVFFFK